MRGIGYTLSRLPKARAFLAGAAILAGAFSSAAHGQMSGSGNGKGSPATDAKRADEAAYAVPRVGHGGPPEVAFPQPLTPGNVALMRRIFAYQEHGNIPESIRVAADLENSLLLGSVLADRYLGRYHRASPDELLDWLAKYRDLPDAPAIHALLRGRLPKGMAAPPAPEVGPVIRKVESDSEADAIEGTESGITRNPLLDRSVLDRALRGNWASALRLITSARGVSLAYAAQLRAEVAQTLFIRNDDANALLVAQLAVNSAPEADKPALGFYIGGLSAWRLDRIETARNLFEDGAGAANASLRLRAASAFWASRASRAMHDARGTVKWLQVAAEQPLTLHGMLARRVLRMDGGTSSRGVLSQADVDAVAATPRGWRAFALLQVGQASRAEAELCALWSEAQQDPVFGHSVMLVTSSMGFTDAASRMAAELRPRDSGGGGELRVALPRLQPAGGFTIDPALVYAVTRLESNFDAKAISPAGARGLMQIMPTTAQYITGDLLYPAERLHEPSTNLAIGQRYLSYLSRQDGIDNDLIRMLASYNSGPGSFLRWRAEIRDNGDPLLFLEAIPIAETRAFVTGALLYLWVYAARMHLSAPSLDDLAGGEFPRFTPLEQGRRMASAAPGLH